MVHKIQCVNIIINIIYKVIICFEHVLKKEHVGISKPPKKHRNEVNKINLTNHGLPHNNCIYTSTCMYVHVQLDFQLLCITVILTVMNGLRFLHFLSYFHCLRESQLIILKLEHSCQTASFLTAQIKRVRIASSCIYVFDSWEVTGTSILSNSSRKLSNLFSWFSTRT